MNGTPIPAEELHEALSIAHYDLYKEVYGVRPRWMPYHTMSTAQLEREVLQLQAEALELEVESAPWEVDEALEREAAEREAIRAHEERWMDQATLCGADGW